MTSVLIVNWNTRDLLAECLGSIRVAFGDEPHEVIVVDNASPDGSAAMVREKFPEVRLIELAGNAGYAAANNLAASRAAGDDLLFLNPDTELRRGCVEALRTRLHSDTRIALVAPKLILPDGTIQHSCRGFPSPLNVILDALGLAALFPRFFGSYRMLAMDYEVAQPVPQPMATCWLMNREAWETVGGFDERFPIFFNDVDWCLRAAKLGLEAWYEPAAVVEHVGGASTRQVRPQMVWESHLSLLRYYRKHLPGGVGSPTYWVLALPVILGALVRAKGWHDGFRPHRDHRELEHP